MPMKVTVEAHIDIPNQLRKIENPEFWEFGANEWWKLITPYTPMRKGTLSESVRVKGESGTGLIEYTSPQAHYLYKGELMVDPVTGSSYARAGSKKVYTDKELSYYKGESGTTGHPLASKEWDKAAEPTKKPELIGAMQDYVDSGRLRLNE